MVLTVYTGHRSVTTVLLPYTDYLGNPQSTCQQDCAVQHPTSLPNSSQQPVGISLSFLFSPPLIIPFSSFNNSLRRPSSRYLGLRYSLLLPPLPRTPMARRPTLRRTLQSLSYSHPIRSHPCPIKPLIKSNSVYKLPTTNIKSLSSRRPSSFEEDVGARS
jgi:hypothetical protein